MSNKPSQVIMYGKYYKYRYSKKVYADRNILICPGSLMGNLMTSQKSTKGLNEPVKMLITFMVSSWKNYRFESVFSRSRENLPLKLIMTVTW